MGISPIYAIRRILKEVGLEKEEVDVYEVRPSDLTSEWLYIVFARLTKPLHRNLLIALKSLRFRSRRSTPSESTPCHPCTRCDVQKPDSVEAP